MKHMPSERSYKERIEIHRFSAQVWASLAKDARDMLATETYSATRERLEAFIVRAITRALRHYREADAVRRRGYENR
jgi:hypothetical protein